MERLLASLLAKDVNSRPEKASEVVTVLEEVLRYFDGERFATYPERCTEQQPVQGTIRPSMPVRREPKMSGPDRHTAVISSQGIQVLAAGKSYEFADGGEVASQGHQISAAGVAMPVPAVGGSDLVTTRADRVSPYGDVMTRTRPPDATVHTNFKTLLLTQSEQDEWRGGRHTGETSEPVEAGVGVSPLMAKRVAAAAKRGESFGPWRKLRTPVALVVSFVAIGGWAMQALVANSQRGVEDIRSRFRGELPDTSNGAKGNDTPPIDKFERSDGPSAPPLASAGSEEREQEGHMLSTSPSAPTLPASGVEESTMGIAKSGPQTVRDSDLPKTPQTKKLEARFVKPVPNAPPIPKPSPPPLRPRIGPGF